MSRTAISNGRPWISTGFLIALVTAVGVWLLDGQAVMQSLDGCVYDTMLSVNRAAKPCPEKVLLVYLDRRRRDDDRLRELVLRLKEAGAKRIGLTFQPHSISPDLERMANSDGVLVLGREYARATNHPNQWELTASPVEDKRLSSGLVGLPYARCGIHRTGLNGVEIGGQSLPTLESVLADCHDNSPRSRAFRIAFRGGPGSLPNLTAQDVLEGNLVTEFVADKTILVGYRSEATFPGVTTPTTTMSGKMSLLEFHGHALNSLLASRQIAILGPIGRLCLYLAVAIASLLIYQRCKLQSGFLIAAALLLLTFGIVLASLIFGRLWLPAAQLTMVQVLSFVLVFERKFRFSYTTLNQMLIDLSVMIRKRRWPTDFFTEEEPWIQILSLMRQVFQLNRAIILELPRRQVHVREVSALNCSFEDINERRRDHRRWPFSTARENKAPLRLDADTHPLLKNRQPGELQYLTPLIFGGELFGFLALGIDIENLAAARDFESRLQDFADELAELLYRRQWILSDQSNLCNPLKALTRIPEVSAYGELVHATHLLERRLERLENMFDTADTASAIYDLFGRLLMVNDRMIQILRTEDVVPSEMTTVDLIVTLTGRQLNDCRRLLREVILEKRQESLPITLEKQAGTFILNIRPLELEVPQSKVVPDDPHPYQLQGIHCELVDRTSIVEMFKSHERAKSASGASDAVATIDFVSSLLEGQVDSCNEVLPREEPALWPPASQAAMSTTAISAEVRGVDAARVLDYSIEAQQAAAKLRGISLEMERTPGSYAVDVDAPLLGEVFEAVLELLLSDCRDDSKIRITMQHGISTVDVTFTNEGFGFEPEQFRRVLFDGEDSCVDELRRLRDAARRVEGWEGVMQVSSDVGQGTSVCVMLRQEKDQ